MHLSSLKISKDTALPFNNDMSFTYLPLCVFLILTVNPHFFSLPSSQKLNVDIALYCNSMSISIILLSILFLKSLVDTLQ